LSAFTQEKKLIFIGDITLLGMQTYFEGERSSLKSYFVANLIPTYKLNSDNIIIFNYNGKYEGTQQVQELLGGGTLYQESMEHGILVKLLHNLGNDFQIKPKIGYKLQYLSETKDEDWGEGLYDYRRFSTGLEIEKNFKELSAGPAEINFGLNFYNYKFPNYEALSAQTKGTEYNAPDTGKNTFDFNAYGFSAIGKIFFSPKWKGQARCNMDFHKFSDQKIVNSVGDYENKKRTNNIIDNTIGTDYLLPSFTLFGIDFKPTTGLNFGLKFYNSNQNHYESSAAVFIKDYYDYVNISYTPNVSLQIGKKGKFSMVFSKEHKKYDGRLVQNEKGVFGTDKVTTDGITFNTTASYKLWKEMSFHLKWLYYKSESNIKYETTYKYNYNGNSILAGLYYEF
jgi:hypothetical protein